MNPIKHLQVLIKFKKPKSLNRTLQILLSIFLCSFLFSYSSFLATSFNSLHLFISEFISNLFNHYINRQLMFILCNGILVFVTGGAGLIGPSTSTTTTTTDDRQAEFHIKNADFRRLEPDNVEVKVCVRDEEEEVEGNVGVRDEEEEVEGNVGVRDEEEEVEGNVGALVHVVAKEEGRGGKEEDCYQTHYDNCENWLLKTGESDQRFDNFIKEMKERMRNEAQKQPVLVV